MKLGDKVLYYSHEISDLKHTTNDVLAFVTGVSTEGVPTSLVLIPAGGPLEFVPNISVFDPKDPYLAPGGYYWREFDSKPPDFNATFPHSMDGEWPALTNRQRAERDTAMPEKRADLLAKHLHEREELKAALVKRYGVTK